jgi:hypothetical protein
MPNFKHCMRHLLTTVLFFSAAIQLAGLTLVVDWSLAVHRVMLWQQLQPIGRQLSQPSNSAPQQAQSLQFRGKPLLELPIPLALEREPNAEFTRIHGKEFRYRGQMYDVVSFRREADTTWYLVHADHKETSLRSTRDQMAREALAGRPFLLQGRHHSGEGPHRPALLDRLPGPALLPPAMQLFDPGRCEAPGAAAAKAPASAWRSVPTPPPRLLLSCLLN